MTALLILALGLLQQEPEAEPPLGHLILTAERPLGAAETVRCGLPLPESAAVLDVASLRLEDSGGRALPCRVRALSRWKGRPDQEDRPIKWAEFVFPVDSSLPAGPLAVRRGAPAGGHLQIDRGEDQRITIKDGSGLEVVLHPGSQQLVDAVEFGPGEGLTSAAAAGEVIYLDEAGERRPAAPWTLSVETSNSVEATLLATTQVDGLEVELRLAFTSRTGTIVADFRVVNRGPYGHMETRSSHRYFRRLGLLLPRPMGADRLAFADGEVPLSAEGSAALLAAHETPRRKGQPSELFPGQFWSTGDLTWQGQRARGLLVFEGAVGEARSAVGWTVDRFWENAPKALSVFPAALVLDLFPEGNHGPEHRGTYGEPDKGPLDERSTKAYRFEGGRAKSTRFRLTCARGTASALRDRLRSTLDRPLHAVPPAAELMGSGALGHPFALPGTSNDPSVARFERMMAMLVDDAAADPQPGLGAIGYPAFVERGGTYGQQVFRGWFNFGDIPWADGYSSLHYDWPYVALLQYLRTSDPRFFSLGCDMTRHRVDIDQDHDTTSDCGQRGGQFYEKGYWHGNYYHPVASHTWVFGPLLHFLLTGDETSKEAALLCRDFVRRNHPEAFDGDWGVRIPGWAADLLLCSWWVFGEPEDLALAEATIANVERIETTRFGGKGYIINRQMNPPSEQPWMLAIFFNAAARHAAYTGSDRFHPLMRRMLHYFDEQAIAWKPAPRVFRHVNPASGLRTEPCVHLAWPLASSFAWGAIVLREPGLREKAARLFREAATHHQESGSSPIAFRMMNYPGSESKILSNIGLWGSVALTSM